MLAKQTNKNTTALTVLFETSLFKNQYRSCEGWEDVNREFQNRVLLWTGNTLP